jgi:nucleoside-diphosphate-sugar epimerase
MKTVLITGAAGNIGNKLRQHFQGRYNLRLLDIDPRDDKEIHQADLSVWSESWSDHFQGVDTVVHMAADPTADQIWDKVVGPNIDAVVNTLTAAVKGGVKRFIFASSNHAMGGYMDIPEPKIITADTPPLPGTHWVVNGKSRDSTAYGSAKLMGERMGKCFSDAYGISYIAVRIGWVQRDENSLDAIPRDRDAWFRLMWLSNPDLCQLMERCIDADPAIKFAVINGMSNNTGMRWDIEQARKLIGYEPIDDATRE